MKQKLDHLQSLRCIAALLIIWQHSGFIIGQKVVDKILGFTGVPLFFIISGFIMVYTTRTIKSDVFLNLKEFTIKRLIRIVPLLYFAMAVWLFICRKDFVKNPEWEYLFNTAFFLPHFIDHTGPFYGFWILGVNWSLNYEMFFYFIFAIAFLFSSKRYYFLYAVFFVLLIGLPLFINRSISFDIRTYVDYKFEYFNLMSNPILWYFVAGMTIGLLIDKVILYVRSKAIIYVYFIVSIAFFIMYISKIFPTDFKYEMLACATLVIAALLMDLYKGINIKVPASVVFLGDISYSIYLMHAVVYFYIPLLVSKYGIEHKLHSWYAFFLIFTIIISVSYITYYVIEKRLTDYLRRKLL